MKYMKTTQKSVEETVSLLESSVRRNDFGVLHIHDLKTTLNNKGISFDRECRIFEICNPAYANRVLSQDMSMNMALPCRISVYEDEGHTIIGMVRPTAMLASLSSDPEMAKIAEEVEKQMVRMIDEVAD
ncbi:MAG: hypothetical protein CO090_07990 [Acidobacteria bacterium CG_4_9_14_3_um_filter_49_7]|nr:MAG: hypothetical protein CO090_07990 [Acidobacteria bacterium CG_4_9_14_3_um_filter_49_7]